MKTKTDKMLLRNNERKMFGLPLHRKKAKGEDAEQDAR